MRALFIASGPAFREGGTIPTASNVDLYALVLNRLLGLPIDALAPNNSTGGMDAALLESS